MTDMTMRNRVDQALGAVELRESDGAAVELARRYADEIDQWERCSGDPDYAGEDGLKIYGPKLLQALDALGLTPKARSAVTKGGGASSASAGSNPVDQIRERREQRRQG
jgi:hypothetical protein